MHPTKATSAICAFHTSPNPDITQFQPCTHFGSREGAAERATAGKFNGQDITLYEVEIDLRNPLEIYDEGGVHTVEYLLDAIHSS